MRELFSLSNFKPKPSLKLISLLVLLFTFPLLITSCIERKEEKDALNSLPPSVETGLEYVRSSVTTVSVTFSTSHSFMSQLL